MIGLAGLKLGAGLLWKGGAILAVIATLIVSGFLVKTQIVNRQITKDRAELTRQINDPVTGYIARLTTARNNVVTLTNAIQRQNSEFTRQSNEAKAELARLTKELKLAQAESAAYQRRVNQIMGTPIKGANMCERVTDVDKMVLEDLRK